MTNYWVYIISNTNNTVLYTGVTGNLERRIYEHKNKLVRGFSQKYNLYKLVYFESIEDINTAIIREKQIKGWLRIKKNALINTINSEWLDLSIELLKDSFVLGDSSPTAQNDNKI